MPITIFKSITLLFLTGALASGARAELLVYEPFDYNTGDFAGRDGGVGMSGAWADGPDLAGTAFVFDERGNEPGLYPLSRHAPEPAWDGVVDNLPTRPETGSRYLSHSPLEEDKFEAYRPLVQNAGELAANDGDNVLWASAVWHFAGQSFGAHAGFALTTDSFRDRGRDLDTSGNHGSGAGDGIGVAGATGSSTSWNSSINPVVFDAGAIVESNTGARFSSSKDNIIILKFEFGETDTVSAFVFTEDEVMTEAAFDAGSVSVSAAIDESTLNLIAFSQNRKENAVDELRIGDTFDDVTTGTAGDPRQPLEVTDVVYHEDRDQITLTWKSNPDEIYGLYWSGDLQTFTPGINPAVPGNPAGSRTTFWPFANPSPDSERLYLQVGPPDVEDPTLERVWGNGTTVSLRFSEAMDAAAATNPANYFVLTEDIAWSIASAELSSDGRTVTLTTAPGLALNTDYIMETFNLTDLASRPLADPTSANFRTWDDDPNGVKVFIMAGQSNMQGHGRNEIGAGGVTGAIGSLRYEVDNDPDNYGHLVDGGGSWISRDDVKVWWRDSELGAARSVKKGNLHPSFGVDTSRFGPEFGFGWVIGDFYDEPVLIIKAAWGGKNLFVDFRPPSAVTARGGEVGPYYTGMFADVHEVLDQLGTEFPEWSGRGYQIVGFGWHQGWNDRDTPFYADGYEDNLVDLINDVRAGFGKADLPISIATTGMAPGASLGPVELAQLAVADPAQHPEFASTIFAGDTRGFWRESTVSPANQGFHWNQNGETYFLIGDQMGEGMETLLTP